MNFPDKFHLPPEQSLFLAKKKWDENSISGYRQRIYEYKGWRLAVA